MFAFPPMGGFQLRVWSCARQLAGHAEKEGRRWRSEFKQLFRVGFNGISSGYIYIYTFICNYMYIIYIYIHKYDFISKNLHMYTIWYYFFFPSATTEIGSLLLEDPKNDQPGSFSEVKIGLDMPKATLKRPITIKLWHWTHIKHVSTQYSYILINHSFRMFLLYGGFLHVSGLCRKHTSLLDIIGLFSFLVSM